MIISLRRKSLSQGKLKIGINSLYKLIKLFNIVIILGNLVFIIIKQWHFVFESVFNSVNKRLYKLNAMLLDKIFIISTIYTVFSYLIIKYYLNKFQLLIISSRNLKRFQRRIQKFPKARKSFNYNIYDFVQKSVIQNNQTMESWKIDFLSFSRKLFELYKIKKGKMFIS